MRNILVTGGAGFIGSCFVRQSLLLQDARIINLDALTYAGNPESLPAASAANVFVHGSINDEDLVAQLLTDYQIDSVINFAAESHVDRSIDGPGAFVETNVTGTYHLLSSVLSYWKNLEASERDYFRFLHVSTDEVYGSLGDKGYFTETTPYSPNSPYSASKAASDHLVRAWFHTYGLPTLITNCSNNYGPHQFPEKLIPLVIINAIEGKPLPIYGDGLNIRDWLYVEDHCDALRTVLNKGVVGETYNVGGDCEKTNLEIVKTICHAVDNLVSGLQHQCENLITFVPDRPGHDRRYAIDASKIRRDLGWTPETSFSEGIKRTVSWYIENTSWVENVTTGKYQRERLGTIN